MSNIDISASIDRAIDKLISFDRILLNIQINERALTHWLAIYLIEEFPNHKVDCEYNRHGIDIKRLALSNSDPENKPTSTVSVLPDIIVHMRGTNECVHHYELSINSSIY